jgi:hypothetical protein
MFFGRIFRFGGTAGTDVANWKTAARLREPNEYELGKVKEGGRNGVKPADGGSPVRRVAPELREQVGK